MLYLYAQFDDLDSVVSIFERLTKPNTLIWNLIIRACFDSGFFELGFSLYKDMRESGVEHDGFTFPIMNRGVVLVENGIRCGQVVHGLAMRMGFESDLYYCNTMIEVYVKYGCFCSACKQFDEMPQRDLVSWTSKISACVKKGNDFGAFTLFCEMQMDLEPNSVTMIVMFQLCSTYTQRNVVQGRRLHGYVIKKGLMIDQSLQNSVLKMYANMGNINDA